jgi:hypothetical protein
VIVSAEIPVDRKHSILHNIVLFFDAITGIYQYSLELNISTGIQISKRELRLNAFVFVRY